MSNLDETKKRIMILGAGVYQVPLIKRASGMGLETVVVCPPGQYPGIPIADIVLPLDTTDTVRIVSAAADYAVEGIVTTGSDVCVATIATVAGALGLIGPTREMADTVSSKTTFRTYLRQHHMRCPEFAICRSVNDAVVFFQKLNAKAVIKPDDSSGSRGVSILEAGQPDFMVREAYHEAARYSRNGIVCAEAFVDGLEVGGDAFFMDGQPVFFTTTSKHMNGVLVLGHSFPGDLPERDLNQVKAAVCRVTDQLGYRDGPVNFDVIIGDGNATILEMGLRNGGNGILDLIYHGTGVDLLGYLLSYALGLPIPVRPPLPAREVSSYVFGSEHAGRLISVSSLGEVQATVPEAFDLILAKAPGESVAPFDHNANLVGYVLVHCGAALYKQVSQRIQNALNVRVE